MSRLTRLNKLINLMKNGSNIPILKKSIAWIKQHLEYVSIFRKVLYVCIIIFLLIIFYEKFNFENIKTMQGPMKTILVYSGFYIYFYLL